MLQDPKWRSRLRGTVLERDQMERLLPAWEDLCGRSLEDNVYYTPRYARSLLETVDGGRSVSFAAVWDGDVLVALLPICRARLGRLSLPGIAQGWVTPFTFSCTPLLDRERAEPAALALVETLASVGAAAWVLPTVNLDGPAAGQFIRALETMGAAWIATGRFERAAFTGKPSFEHHMQVHVGSKRRRELARNRRRLEELGEVAHETHLHCAGLDRAVDAFLRIEASGWKGRRGTALACRDDTRGFALSTFRGDRGRSICRADMLTLNGEPIAVSLMVIAGGTGFTVKCTFDEAYRSLGVGLLLEVEVIRSFLDGDWAQRLDAATAGSHVIDKLWPGRIEVADVMFAFGASGARLRLQALRRAFEGMRSLKRTVKEGLSLVR